MPGGFPAADREAKSNFSLKLGMVYCGRDIEMDDRSRRPGSGGGQASRFGGALERENYLPQAVARGQMIPAEAEGHRE